MRIGIDISTFNTENIRGIAVCAVNLLKHLKRLCPEDIFCYEIDWTGSSDYCPNAGNWLKRRYKQFKWYGWAAKRLVDSDNIDIFHSLNFFIPRLGKRKIISTFADLFAITHPQFLPAWYSLPAKYLYPKILHDAKAVITPSQYTQEQIHKHFPKTKGKLHIIHNGVDEIFRLITDDSVLNDVRRKYALPEKFILYVGALDKRKNINFIYELYRRYSRSKRESRMGLVLVGSAGLNYAGVPEFAAANPDIVHTGYAPIEDLVAIYNLAELFIFPSILEGFGIPPIEAMRCGTPVLASDSTALPEISGGGAMILPLNDYQRWLEAIDTVQKDSGIKKELINKGLEWSKRYSWSKAAKQTYELYQRVYES